MEKISNGVAMMSDYDKTAQQSLYMQFKQERDVKMIKTEGKRKVSGCRGKSRVLWVSTYTMKQQLDDERKNKASRRR